MVAPCPTRQSLPICLTSSKLLKEFQKAFRPAHKILPLVPSAKSSGKGSDELVHMHSHFSHIHMSESSKFPKSLTFEIQYVFKILIFQV